MNTQLEKFIRTIVKKPKEHEIKDILNLFKERHFSKGEIFKDKDTISKEIGFLINGSIRFYIIKNNGDEITGKIAQKDNFILDFISMKTNEGTPIIIESLERSSMLVASIKDIQNLLDENLTLNILMREYIADNAVELGKRHLLFLTGTAKERYQFILENNPNLLKKFPLRFIASIIGITPTQLSRIRNRK